MNTHAEIFSLFSLAKSLALTLLFSLLRKMGCRKHSFSDYSFLHLCHSLDL